MKVLYVSQYFHPEIGASTNRAAAIALAFKEAGHSVTLLCEMPNHPQGVIFPGYRGKFSVREDFQGIPVIHLPVIASPRKSFLTRGLMYISFSVSAIGYLLFRRPRYDLIYVSSPPLFVALAGLWSKLIFPRRKLVFEVRDLWPDSAIQLGELNNRWLIKFSQALERRVYRQSDLVVGVTNYIGERLAAKGVSRSKILVSRNGVDDVMLANSDIAPQRPDDGTFTVIFAGNMGLVYDLEPVIHAADLLRGEPLRFLFIGGGPSRPNLEDLTRQLRLSNVEFRDPVPLAEVGKVLATADIGVISLKDLPVMRGALPVKLFDFMAYRLPVLCAIGGETAEIVTEAGAGIVVPPGNAQQIAQALKQLLRDPETSRQMGANGRDYVLNRFRRSDLARLLVAELASRFGSAQASR